MKKIILCLFTCGSISLSLFSQTTILHQARVLGSVPIGNNKEVTSIIDEITNCSHKSLLHSKGLFVVGEMVSLEFSDADKLPKIIKPNLPEVIFVDKCNKKPINLGESKVFIPNGSTITREDDRIFITPPSAWKYIFKTEENGNSVFRIRGGSIGLICDCKKTDGSDVGGCHPSLDGQGNFECIMTSPCLSCERGSRSVDNGISEDIITSERGSGFININEGISFITDSKPMPSYFSAMSEIPEIKKAMDDFVNQFYQNKTIPETILDGEGRAVAPEDHSFVLVNFFGRAAYVLIPKSFISNLSNERRVVATQLVSCGCVGSGGGTCKLIQDGTRSICQNKCGSGACEITPSVAGSVKSFEF